MTVLVTGATGTIGTRLVRHLVQDGVRPRALVRDPARAATLLGPGVELVHGDLMNPASMRAALHGVDTLVLLTPNGPDQVRVETAAVDAAVATGVTRLVKVSARGAHPEASNAFWRGHAMIEAHLAAAGVPAVVLRPSFLMTNLLVAAELVRTAGVLPAPAGHGLVAMVDPADVAAVASQALLDRTVPPGFLELTGPQPLSHHDVAATLSRALGRTVRYVPTSAEDAVRALVATGVPDAAAREVVRIYDSLRRGDQATTTGAVPDITGRPATPFTAFVRQHAAAFGHSVPVAR